MSPITRRRWANFRHNRRGFASLCLFVLLFTTSLFAEFIANDKPLVVEYEDRLYFPIFQPSTRRSNSAAFSRWRRTIVKPRCRI